MKEELKREYRENLARLKEKDAEVKKVAEEVQGVKGDLNTVDLQIRSRHVQIKDDRRFIKHR